MMCLSEVHQGGFSQPLIESLGRPLSSLDQRLLRQLVLGVLRHRNRLDDLIKPHSKKPINQLDEGVLNALRLGCFQLRLLDKIPAHAAVSTTVEAFKLLYGRKAAGFVNGVLRSLLRIEREAAPQIASAQDLSRYFSQPMWLVEAWHHQLGFEATRALCETLNQPAPLTIRPHSVRDAETVKTELMLESATVTAGRYVPYAMQLNHPEPFKSKSHLSNLWTVQDEASQLVVELLDPQAGERIWDVCAAPGGKTRLIDWLTSSRAEILATDLSIRKVSEMQALLDQDNITIERVDARKAHHDRRFDKILLDAPCTALGTIRRHPEIRWRRSPADVEIAATLQAELLEKVAQYVAVGGSIVYSVCSSMKQEGPQVIESFLQKSAHFCCERPLIGRIDWTSLWQENGVQLWPHEHGTDGFFATRLIRKE